MSRESRGVSAFVLHQREWQDNGQIFELLTATHGRMCVFAQGVRGLRSRLGAILRPFVPLLVSWAGRGEAPRLTGAEIEPQSLPYQPLPTPRLMSGFYMNELLVNLTLRHDVQPELFTHYRVALASLRDETRSEAYALRLFEKRLLDVLGYGLPEQASDQEPDPLGVAQLPASVLERLVQEQIESPQELELVRPVLKRALNYCLEGKPLRTREVARNLAHWRRTS
jgi:DNA repair protein RecO (recombination protein O)